MCDGLQEDRSRAVLRTASQPALHDNRLHSMPLRARPRAACDRQGVLSRRGKGGGVAAEGFVDVDAAEISLKEMSLMEFSLTDWELLSWKFRPRSWGGG